MRYLPLNERGGVLQEALAHQDAEVAALAIRQVAWLPKEERAAILWQALKQKNQTLTWQAVLMAPQLPLSEHRRFLQEAGRHPLPEVSRQARFDLGRLPAEGPGEG